MLCTEHMHSTLLLLPDIQKWQLHFLVSLDLLFRICPNSTCTQLFLVPYSFFVFCCLRSKRCSTVAKGPRSQPVSPLSRGLSKRRLISALSSHTVTGYLLCPRLWLHTLGFRLSLSWIQNRNVKRKTIHGEGNGNPLQYSCLGNTMGRGASRAAVHGVTKSQTELSIHTHTCNLTVAIGETICLWYPTIKTVHLKKNWKQSLVSQIAKVWRRF